MHPLLTLGQDGPLPLPLAGGDRDGRVGAGSNIASGICQDGGRCRDAGDKE